MGKRPFSCQQQQQVRGENSPTGLAFTSSSGNNGGVGGGVVFGGGGGAILGTLRAAR